ncbi:MAG TPA: hypothetical protein VMW66_02465, partial [Elusimicrobiales bacterium]|nr:hypothetical protein [Elusimicrobiales bacterium]
MNDNATYRYMWKFANTQKEGVFFLNKEKGSFLEIHLSLEEIFGNKKYLDNSKIVLGYCNNTPITLYDYEIENEPNCKIIKPRYVFWGYHFKQIEDMIFKRVETSYFNSENWTRYNFFENDFVEKGKITINKPLTISAKLKTFTLSLKSNVSTFYKSDEPQLKIYNKNRFEFNFEKHSNFQECLKNGILLLQDFLTFAFGKPAIPIDIILTTTDNEDVKVFYNSGIKKAKSHLIYSQLIPFDLIRTNPKLQLILSKWIEIYENSKYALELYIHTKTMFPLTWVHKFMFLTQSLEILCNSVDKQGNILKKNEFREVKTKLSKTIKSQKQLDDNLKDIFINRLYLINLLPL